MIFSQKIIAWYKKNMRDLPWRHTKDPYKVWLSEIILQQTRVQQGLPYYNKFIKLYPNVHKLAEAKEEEIIKAWQGLGYYSRARNLHTAAKYIKEHKNGNFPETYDEIRKLKGVGDYTAAAIASFAFDEVYPVVDGNVYRVLARYLGIAIPIDTTEGKKTFLIRAQNLIDKKHPGIYNQAIMEFGALQCVSSNPDCKKCLLKNNCNAFANNLIQKLPFKKVKPKIRPRYFNYFVIEHKHKILLNQRIKNDIWKNMYDFPLIETNKPISHGRLVKMVTQENIYISASPYISKHILSHQIIFAKFWQTQLINDTSLPFAEKKTKFVSKYQLSKFPLPRPIEKYFAKLGVLH